MHDCEGAHAIAICAPVESGPVEIFLHLWDEIDDLFGACRHALLRLTA
jgi:hypothetical protein